MVSARNPTLVESSDLVGHELSSNYLVVFAPFLPVPVLPNQRGFQYTFLFIIKNPNSKVPSFFCQFQPQSSLSVLYFLELEILLSEKVHTYSIT